MSFFGKKYKKFDADNIIEFLEACNVSEKIRTLLRKLDAVTSFVNNNDGSIQYVVEIEGKNVIDQKIVLGEERDFITPDGMLTKNLFTLDGDVLKATMTLHDGSTITFVRSFESDKMTLELSSSKTDIKAVVKYMTV